MSPPPTRPPGTVPVELPGRVELRGRVALAVLVFSAGLLVVGLFAASVLWSGPALQAWRSPRAAAGRPAAGVVLAASRGTLPTPVTTTSAVPATTVAPATTVVPIQRQLPAPPVTLPLSTKQASTRLSPWLARVSLGAFALFVLLVLIQLVLTRPRRRGRWTL